jgi:hypothetical protein
MTNALELQVMIDKLKISTYFTGVRCKVELCNNGHQPLEEECGIINLNDSDTSKEENIKTGHWTAYHRKNKNNYYFCSYGSPPPLALIEYLGISAENRVRWPLHTHNFQIQDFRSNVYAGNYPVNGYCLWIEDFIITTQY